MTITAKDKYLNAPEPTSLLELSKREGSPCLKCMVSASCRRSFVDKSACEEFAKFLKIELIKCGIKIGKGPYDE